MWGTAAIAALLAVAPAAAQVAPAGEIVVTGSRLARPEREATSPIAVIGSEAIRAQGVANAQDLLQKLPQFGIPGFSRTNTNIAATANGVSSLNLRNLSGISSARTLVLVNGRRFVPGVAGTATVDVNDIPVDFIDRIEIVTGGASAVYGSDAIAGVVNFILKDRMEGVTARIQHGVTARGDMPTTQASLSGGFAFGADRRGSAVASFSHSRDAGLFSRDRAISSQDCLYSCGPEAYSSYAPQGRFQFYNGATPSAAGAGGNVFTFDPGNGLVMGFPASYGFNRNAVRRISVPLERYLAAGSATYALGDRATAFLEGMYAKVRSSSALEAYPLDSLLDLGVGYSIANPYIPAPIAAQIAARNGDAEAGNNVTSIQIRRRLDEVFSRGNAVDRDTYRVAGGLRGKLAGGWGYEVSAVYGRAKDHTETGDIDTARFVQALDAVRDASGAIVCADAAARAAGCFPLNLFGYDSADPRASAYIRSAAPRSDDVSNTQTMLDASLSGPILALPHGPVQALIGAEYRRERSVDDWDALTNAGGNSGNRIPDRIGQFSVKEAFGELDAPLTRSVSVQGQARYSDYSTIGSVLSWAVGGRFRLSRAIGLRGHYSVANRAPNIAELFSAQTETFPAVSDPCNGATATTAGDYGAACRAIPGVAAAIAATGRFVYGAAELQSINGFDGGNPGLHEETGRTYGFGAVLTPRRIPGLSLAIDYFHIAIEGAIGVIGRDTSIRQCLLTGLSQFCGSVIRDPASGFITTVNARNTNVAMRRTAGVDFDLRYAARPGLVAGDRLDLRVLYTRTARFDVRTDPSAPIQSGLGNLAYGRAFKHKANADLHYSLGRFTFGWNTTFLSKMLAYPASEFDPAATADLLVRFFGLAPAQAATAAGHNRIKARLYHAAQLQARAGPDGAFEFFAGVDNLFDRKPPVLEDGLYGSAISIPGTTTAADVYDPYGRRFYAGAQARF